MTKTHILHSIANKLQIIEAIYDRLDIKAGHLHFNESSSALHIQELDAGLKWISGILLNELNNYQKIRRLLTEEQWKRYELWGDDFSEHQEVVLLKKAGAALRKRLVEQCRPSMFKKGYLENVKSKLSEKKHEKGSHRSNSRRTKDTSGCDADSIPEDAGCIQS